MREPRIKLYRGVWAIVATQDGRTVRTSLGTRDEDEAKRRFADWSKPARGDTVGDIFDAYLKDREQRIRHHERLKGCWQNLKPECAHLRPDQIDRRIGGCSRSPAGCFSGGRPFQPVSHSLEIR